MLDVTRKKIRTVFVHILVMSLIAFILFIITMYTQPLNLIHYVAFIVVAFGEFMYLLYARDEWKKAFTPRVEFSSVIHQPEAQSNKEPDAPVNLSQTYEEYPADVKRDVRLRYDARPQTTQKNTKRGPTVAWG
jgi:hypothetical protein